MKKNVFTGLTSVIYKYCFFIYYLQVNVNYLANPNKIVNCVPIVPIIHVLPGNAYNRFSISIQYDKMIIITLHQYNINSVCQ